MGVGDQFQDRRIEGGVMDMKTVVHFPMTEMYVCADCSSVTNSTSWCPSCCSNTLTPLTRWLNRPSTSEPAPVDAPGISGLDAAAPKVIDIGGYCSEVRE